MFDRRRESHRQAVGCVFLPGFDDHLVGVAHVHDAAQFAGAVITLLNAHARDVHWQAHAHRHEGNERLVRVDSIFDRVLEDLALEDFKGDIVGAVGRGRHAEDAQRRISKAQRLDHRAVAIGGAVVRLVDNQMRDGAVLQHISHSSLSGKRLHGSADNLGAGVILSAHDNAGHGQLICPVARNAVARLLDQLLAVRQNDGA